jgi:hypothetical protein
VGGECSKTVCEQSAGAYCPNFVLGLVPRHMMSSVVNKIQELGVEVEHIPGGCTCYCQPLDVGGNKPFKDRIREQWVSWMLQDVTENGSARPHQEKKFLPEHSQQQRHYLNKIVKNAWRSSGYS